MALSNPRTDILSVDFTDQSLKLVSRQEYSRTAFGTTIGKDLGSAIWMASWTTGPLPNLDALAYEAKLNSLDGIIIPFEGGDMRDGAQYPSASVSAILASVNANNKAISLSGVGAGAAIAAGQYLSFTYGSSRALHQVVESTTADGSGVTPQFEVRPYLRPGWSLSTAVELRAPRGLFRLVPGSLSSTLNGNTHTVITFQAMQAL